MSLAVYVSLVCDKKNTYIVFVGATEGKISLGRPNSKLVGIIKINVKAI
jgi:hypothetical protein